MQQPGTFFEPQQHLYFPSRLAKLQEVSKNYRNRLIDSNAREGVLIYNTGACGKRHLKFCRRNKSGRAMSSDGLGSATRTFYGSTAAGILQQVDRPLLIIRTQRL